ncbi:MAG: phospholipase/Carboxylesterase [Solirubrobacterales bacterium]|nr:phospholipase/Carboxylesterase [Solirubrobacterales bacterium]
MSLIHRIREVENPAGNLVLLHGRGADEHDLFGLFDVLDPGRTLRGITVGGPLTNIPPGGRHWYVVPRVGFPEPETFGASYAALASLLDVELGLDWSRTVVGGFSQGTVMSYALGLGTGRPVPAGVLAFSGFVPTVDGWTPDVASRSGLRVFVAHGTNDPIMVPEFAHDARKLLEAGGARVEYHETAAAHHIDPRVIPEAQRWLRDTIAAAPLRGAPAA